MKLREISKIISGYYFRSSITSFGDGDAKLIQPSDLDDFDVNNLTTIDAPSVKLEKGDILLSNRGKFRAIAMPVDGCFVFPSSIYTIRLTSKKYIPEFVVAIFNSESGQSRLSVLSSGSNVSNLTKASLEEFELPIATLEYQKNIAEVDLDLSKYRSITERKAKLIQAIQNNIIKSLFINVDSGHFIYDITGDR